MAKMISKFHVLIQSKSVWIVFVALVVISFVLLPVAANFSNRSSDLENAPGLLSGKPVPREEYESARTQTYLSLIMMSMMYGQELEFNEQVRKYVNEVAWKRLATLRQARKLGFRAFDTEIAEYIKGYPLFSPEGDFNPEIYAAFKHQFLPARGFAGADFEKYAADEVVLQKTQRMVAGLGIISPVKIEQSLDLLRTEFKLEYALMTREMVMEDVETTEDDARAYYEANPNSFIRPERLDLKYVYFSYADFADQVDTPDDEAVREYYNNNLGDYITEAESAAEADDAVDEILYKPFDEVKPGIVAKLVKAESAKLAIDKANAMVFELPPDRNGRARAFEDVADEMGIAVQDLAPFSTGQSPELSDAPELVAREGDQLRPNPDEYFSDAVPGDEGVYILALIERMPKFVPPFEDVRDEAMEFAREINIENAVDEKIVALKNALDEKLDDEASFSDLIADWGLVSESTDTFTLETAGEVLPKELNPRTLTERIAYLNQGEIIDPVAVADGRLIALVSRRALDDSASDSSLRRMIYQSLGRDTTSILYDHWQGKLLEEANFKDLSAVASDTE